MLGQETAERRARIVRRDDSWTFVETEVVRDLWPDVAAIRRRLPHRSVAAVRDMARRCRARPPRVQHVWTAAENTKLKKMFAEGIARADIAEALGLTRIQVKSQIQYARLKRERRPKMLGSPLFDSIRQRAYDMKISFADLDRSLGFKSCFGLCDRKRPPSPRRIQEAVKALGGRLVIEWDEL